VADLLLSRWTRYIHANAHPFLFVSHVSASHVSVSVSLWSVPFTWSLRSIVPNNLSLSLLSLSLSLSPSLALSLSRSLSLSLSLSRSLALSLSLSLSRSLSLACARALSLSLCGYLCDRSYRKTFWQIFDYVLGLFWLCIRSLLTLTHTSRQELPQDLLATAPMHKPPRLYPEAPASPSPAPRPIRLGTCAVPSMILHVDKSVKRDLILRQKRPAIEAKESYICVTSLVPSMI
jgi:hypothetical protein